ncbi:hypothetical protein JMJ77_0003570 [Colletotrichum scovillei]|uniref:Uncharacterized protein n=1 Tax=Colletotrichum scovillei TaxID=1209932 RepID=A0A9P7QR33_9PEZI|nr:hypothetical protein JMJ78_0005077 [Colletotrichum scovillei]KAG7041465.1 hypothetical protein JMJ77_0003570 [Colletotrichum scovillei]KAG7061497.1 hypothetical protein JMJ76_0001060 [Colletotrichum scovillei]
MGSPSGPLRPRASSNFMGIRASGFPPSMTPQEKHLFSTHVNTATTRLSSTMAASETGEGYVFVVYFHKTTAADALALLQAADIRTKFDFDYRPDVGEHDEGTGEGLHHETLNGAKGTGLAALHHRCVCA